MTHRRKFTGAVARGPMAHPLPEGLWVFVALYGVASLLHFAHNAEYIAFYPNMPEWLTREKVYLAWLAVSAFGVAGGVLALAGWRVSAAAFLAVYGALGLYGLGHYALALCSEHTVATNLTIVLEAASGVALAALAGRFVVRQTSLLRALRPAPRGRR